MSPQRKDWPLTCGARRPVSTAMLKANLSLLQMYWDLQFCLSWCTYNPPDEYKQCKVQHPRLLLENVLGYNSVDKGLFVVHGQLYIWVALGNALSRQQAYRLYWLSSCRFLKASGTIKLHLSNYSSIAPWSSMYHLGLCQDIATVLTSTLFLWDTCMFKKGQWRKIFEFVCTLVLKERFEHAGTLLVDVIDVVSMR